ncbi:MAG: hypothetical protein II424_06465 [Bacteroidales bacterium]|nr:hypothetical protein [Bacteroidales bacterium]
MKKLFVIAAMMLVCAGAFAQRGIQNYVSLGVTGITNESEAMFQNPGVSIAYGLRNFNPEAFVSFSYGGEVFASFVPLNKFPSFATYAAPEIGIVIGPVGVKGHFHAGPLFGYNSLATRFGIGWKSGFGIDIGRHIGLDGSYYWLKGNQIAAFAVQFRF